MGKKSRARAAEKALRARVEGTSTATVMAGNDGMSDVGGATVLSLLPNAVRGAPIGESEALSIPAVLRALEVLCALFAMCPLHYYRETPEGKERVTDAPEALIFRRRANDVQPAYLLKEVMLGDLLMRGKFGAYIHRDELYRAAKLTRLDPAGMAPPVQHWTREDGMELFFDVQLPDGTRPRLTRNDCWFVPGFSRNGLVGVDRLKLLQDTIEAAAATSQFAARFWQNNAQPSTVLTTKAKVAPEEKQRIRRDWQDRFAGPRNAGSTAVLDQEMKAEFLSHNNKEAQYLEVRQFYVVEIARAWGVPPHVLFELSRATFSNIEQQSLELILYCMMGHFERVAAAATHQFARDGHFFEFLPDALLKGDIKSRYEAYAIAVDKGVLNPNEVRRRENLNDRDGGDEYRVGSGSQIEGQQPAALPAPDHRTPTAPAPAEED